MPVQSVVPTGIGSQDSWTSSTGNKVTDVSTNDGDTAYISRNTLVAQWYTFPVIPADAAAVSAASVTCVVRTEATPAIIKVYGGAAYGPEEALTTSYASKSVNLDSLVIATINGYHLGLTNAVGTLNTRRCTYIVRDVVYVQVGAFFISIYNLVGPLLVGANLMLRDFLRMSQFSQRRIGPHRIVHTPEEVAQAWHEYKDKTYKFPHHFDLSPCRVG